MLEFTPTFEWTCPHCGRHYDSLSGHRTGFVKSAAETHISACGRRTPAERRAADARDKVRWSRRGTAYKITLNPDHPGLWSTHPAGGPSEKSECVRSTVAPGKTPIGGDGGAPQPLVASTTSPKSETPAEKGFRRLKKERLRRSDEVRWAPAHLARYPPVACRADPTWGPITQGAWYGFNRTRASDWQEYEFRRGTTIVAKRS